MDQESNRSKGTAFACYWKKEDADKVIVISEALSKETGLVGAYVYHDVLQLMQLY